MVYATGGVYVRRGPGTDYEAIASLVFREARPIRGRAANAEWWLIELGDGSTGWVAHLAVQVTGYTGLVPTVEVPALPNGATPTPGPLWNPTPDPVCTVVPTATATVTATLAAVASSTATALPTATSTPAPSPTTGLAEVSLQPTNTVPAAANTIVPTNAPPTPALSAQTLTPSPVPSASTSEPSSNVVLYGGLALIVTAGIVAVASRRQA